MLSQQNPHGTNQAIERLSFLAQCSVFQHLNTADLQALAHGATEITCSPGHILYRPGDANKALFMLRDGMMQLYHLSADGRKLVLATPEIGTCFGFSIQPTSQTHQSFAESLTSSRIYIFNKIELELLLSQRPAITLALLSSLEQRLHTMEQQLIDTTFKSVLARLASLLLQIAQAHPREHENLVVTGLTHEELAERLGVYRETVSSALRELRDAHVIQLNRRRIIISSPERLASIAHTE